MSTLPPARAEWGGLVLLGLSLVLGLLPLCGGAPPPPRAAGVPRAAGGAEGGVTSAEARIAELERKLAHQRARSRMLKAELRAAHQAISYLQDRSEREERIWNNYLARNGFLQLFTLYANCQAAAKMMGLTVEQFAHMGGPLSIADIRAMVLPSKPPPP